MEKTMFVVLVQGPEKPTAMPFETEAAAGNYARREAWDLFDGDVDEVQIHTVATDDRKIARDRVLAGNSRMLRRVSQEKSADHRQREEKAAAIKTLATVGLGDTSMKRG